MCLQNNHNWQKKSGWIAEIYRKTIKVLKNINYTIKAYSLDLLSVVDLIVWKLTKNDKNVFFITSISLSSFQQRFTKLKKPIIVLFTHIKTSITQVTSTDIKFICCKTMSWLTLRSNRTSITDRCLSVTLKMSLCALKKTW